MDRKQAHRYMLKLSTSFFMLLMYSVVYATPLTLKQAEVAALLQSPEIKSLEAKTSALLESSVAAGQLPDPKLMIGAMNVPVDTFDFSQEPMTQIQVGLQQNFPRGRSLHYRRLQTQSLSTAEFRKQQAMQLQILQGVRLSWLNLYYWTHAEKIILKQKKIFRHLLNVTESMLANNKSQQKDVVRAQLELSELNNRLYESTQQIATARAGLSRWIGGKLANEAEPASLAFWHTPPMIKKMQAELYQHPLLKIDDALIAAAKFNVQLAEQQYKPGFALSAAYGFRQGDNIDGRGRADFFSAQVNVDVPLFTRNRQDRTLKASKVKLVASEENKMSHARELRKTLDAEYAAWQQQRKSTRLYKTNIIPEAQQYAEATMAAYQNTQTDFPTLARAYVLELHTALAGLKAAVNRDIARINLLYVQGQ